MATLGKKHLWLRYLDRNWKFAFLADPGFDDEVVSQKYPDANHGYPDGHEVDGRDALQDGDVGLKYQAVVSQAIVNTEI